MKNLSFLIFLWHFCRAKFVELSFAFDDLKLANEGGPLPYKRVRLPTTMNGSVVTIDRECC